MALTQAEIKLAVKSLYPNREWQDYVEGLNPQKLLVLVLTLRKEGKL